MEEHLRTPVLIWNMPYKFSISLFYSSILRNSTVNSEVSIKIQTASLALNVFLVEILDVLFTLTSSFASDCQSREWSKNMWSYATTDTGHAQISYLTAARLIFTEWRFCLKRFKKIIKFRNYFPSVNLSPRCWFSEAVVHRCFSKQVFIKTLQYSQENTYTDPYRPSFTEHPRWLLLDFCGSKYFFSTESGIYCWPRVAHLVLLRTPLTTRVKPQKQPLALFCKKRCS